MSSAELSPTNANVVSGKDFKLDHPNASFCVVQDKSYNSRFSYNTGVNEDPNPFDLNLHGFHFIDIHQLYLWLDRCIYIRQVEIMDDSLIFLDGEEYKTNKFILGEKHLISELSLWRNSEWCSTVVRYWPHYFVLKCSSCPHTEELCLAAVRRSYEALKYIKDPSEALCIEALHQSYKALQYIKEQSDAVCLVVVRHNGLALQYVLEQTDEICLAAVQQTGDALPYVKHKTLEIGLTALSQYGLDV